MKIFLWGPAAAQRVAQFEAFAGSSRTPDLELVRVTSPEVFNAARPPCGILVFDDGQPQVVEALAAARENFRYMSVPVLAVAGRPGREIHARLLAAGAGAVCEADASDAEVLAELVRRCSARPLQHDIHNSVLQPFTAVTQMAVREMAGLEATVSTQYAKQDYAMFGDISAVIGLMSKTEGSMVLCFPRATAVAFTVRVLQGVIEQPGDDMVRDCVGEIANVVAGQARGALEHTPHAFDLSTPTIITGAGHEIRHKPGTSSLVTAFHTPAGDFALQVCMKL